jgi:hypothetical protein
MCTTIAMTARMDGGSFPRTGGLEPRGGHAAMPAKISTEALGSSTNGTLNWLAAAERRNACCQVATKLFREGHTQCS